MPKWKLTSLITKPIYNKQKTTKQYWLLQKCLISYHFYKSGKDIYKLLFSIWQEVVLSITCWSNLKVLSLYSTQEGSCHINKLQIRKPTVTGIYTSLGYSGIQCPRKIMIEMISGAQKDNSFYPVQNDLNRAQYSYIG